MINTEQMAKDFIERRKAFNKELRLNQSGERTITRYERNYGSGEDFKKVKVIEECSPFRLKEKPLNENPELLMVTYNNGKGGMVIDQAELNKLPKAVQNKIFNLYKI